MRLSDSYASAHLKYLLGQAAMPSPPSEIWVALSTNHPESDGGTFNEVSGNGYGRMFLRRLSNPSPDTMIPTVTDGSREVSNNRQMVWPKATGAYSVGGFGFFSAETGGTPFAVGDLGTAENPVTVDIPVGALPMFEVDGFNLYVPD